MTEPIPQPTAYVVARRERVEGPWYADGDGGVEHATYDEAAEACTTARMQTGVRYEIQPVYAPAPEPEPEPDPEPPASDS
ncbi:hypothetical protein [Nocardia sp. CY41]|uniref:hypothetical protein n=1 Tax=Nocardia sp. CY41 TaxID=2608686 RepID=UPI001359C167|nr:hypothetical protein [Nocardia sp. CY41]